ncbi:MAG: 50S ribosomal protein L11 methyltransferase [Bacteroidetes bacterium]|nr:MAG: 50S ribosomal protein L11 methyltransferase [Bacteroidota bacterium]
MNNSQQFNILCNVAFKEILMAEFAAIGFDNFQETNDGFITNSDTNVDLEQVDGIIIRYNEQSGVTYNIEEVAKKNWNKEWEESYSPIIVSDKCIVRASFHPPQPEYPIEIIITPKMSFGTGHHETTYLIMAAQLTIDHTNKVVLDAGCGTGILSILAGKLGAKSLTAYDNDEWVLDNVQENLKNNDTQSKILVGTVQKLEFNEEFDIILANINKNVLLIDIPFYAKLLNKGGSLLLSGFYQNDLEEIEISATGSGLRLVKTNTKNDWAMAQFITN